MNDDEPTTQELKAQVIKQAEQDPRRAEKAKYLKEKLDERERSEREAGIGEDVPPEGETRGRRARRRCDIRRMDGGPRLRRPPDRARVPRSVARRRDQGGPDKRLGARPLQARRHRAAGGGWRLRRRRGAAFRVGRRLTGSAAESAGSELGQLERREDRLDLRIDPI